MFEIRLADQIEMLRVQLETACPTPPALLVVSSARVDDGKSVVASELARSMAAAGYTTLLVLADEQTQNVDSALEPKSLVEVSHLGLMPCLDSRSSPSLGMMILRSDNARDNTVSRDAVERFCEMCRRTYQVTIVEAIPMLEKSFAAFAAAAADGVLITAREGRRVYDDDRQLAKTLAGEQVTFLGVVCVAASIIQKVPHSLFQDRGAREKIPTITADLGPSLEGQRV
jgi:Mrp family chromosome partitioning ATPase